MFSLRLCVFPRAAFAGALLAATGVPAIAASINSTVQHNAQDQSATLTAGQQVTLSGPGYVVNSVTDWGVNRVYGSTATTADTVNASSTWILNITLSGGNPGDFVPVDLAYSFHGILGPLQDARYGYELMNYCLGSTDQGGCHPVGPTDRHVGYQGFNDLEQCTQFNDPALAHNPGASCEGTYNYQGTVHTTNFFRIGTTGLMGQIGSTVDAGTVDAFNTGRVLSVTVPDGITWSYEAGINGNPLNIRTASAAAAPEPGTFLLLSLGLAGLARRGIRGRH